MAENKKGFILYCDLIHTLEQLPNEKAGELFKHILRYVNDQNPVTDDLITNITFEPIRQQLKRDLNKWQEKSVKRSEAGRLGGFKSGEARKAIASNNEANEAIASKSKQNEQVTVIVTDTVTVTDKEKEILIKNKKEDLPWKKDFEIYKNDLRLAYNKAIITKNWIKERETFHPNLDIELSLKKSCIDFWATEKGWKNKKASKTNEIDWIATFNNALTQKVNQVYKNNSPKITPINEPKINIRTEW